MVEENNEYFDGSSKDRLNTQKGLIAIPEARSSFSVSQVPNVKFIKFINGLVHGISGIILIYALFRNGETSGAMFNPLAMNGEIRIGIIVGAVFLLRFIWVQTKKSARGKWTTGNYRTLPTKIIRFTNWAIYLAIMFIVISGFMIAYLRPGATVIPDTMGLTNHSDLNLAINTHVFFSSVLEWLCAFHVLYFLWVWIIGKTNWGIAAETWYKNISVKDRTGIMAYTSKLFTH